MSLKNFLIIFIFISIFSSSAMKVRSTNITIAFDKENFHWKTWSLHSYNKNLNVHIDGFKDEEERKSLAGALHILYARLSHNVFDVSALEDALLNKFEYTALPYPQGNNFCKSKLSINGFDQDIIITQQISANLEIQDGSKIIALGVNSKILQRLIPSDVKCYKDSLLELSETLLSPSLEKNTHRHIYLNLFADRLSALSQKYEWNMKRGEELDVKEVTAKKLLEGSTSKSISRLRNAGALIGGVSLGLNIGFFANYLLRDYLHDNPKYVLPLFGLTALVGGLSGYLFAKS